MEFVNVDGSTKVESVNGVRLVGVEFVEVRLVLSREKVVNRKLDNNKAKINFFIFKINSF